MRDLNRPQPIHPADCACPRCDPRLLGARRRTTIQAAICGLILALACAGAIGAILGTN